MIRFLTSKFPGIVAAAVILSIGVCSVRQARMAALVADDNLHAGSASTLRAQNLLVDNTSTLNGTVTANGSVGGIAMAVPNGILNGGNEVWSYGGATVMANGFLDFGWNTNAAATGYINRVGYHSGTSQFRDLEIDDGKGILACYLTGSTKNFNCLQLGAGSSFFASNSVASYFNAGRPGVSKAGNVGFGGAGSTSNDSPIDLRSSWNTPALTTNTVGAGGTPNTLLNVWSADFYDATTSGAKTYGIHNNTGGDISAGANGMTIIAEDLVVGSATASYLVSLQTEDFVGQSIGTVEWHAGHIHRHTGLPVATTCGGGGTASGDDVQGSESVGTGVVPTCTITFREPWLQETETGTCPGAVDCVITVSAVTPNCVVTSRSGLALSYTPTSTTLAVTATSLTGSTFDWHCEAPN